MIHHYTLCNLINFCQYDVFVDRVDVTRKRVY